MDHCLAIGLGKVSPLGEMSSVRVLLGDFLRLPCPRHQEFDRWWKDVGPATLHEVPAVNIQGDDRRWKSSYSGAVGILWPEIAISSRSRSRVPHQRYGFHQSLYMRDTYESFVLGRLFPLGFSFSQNRAQTCTLHTRAAGRGADQLNQYAWAGL